MLCEKCKKNLATYHSRTIINGKVTEEHLCEDCASKMKTNNFNNWFNNLFDDSLFEVFKPFELAEANFGNYFDLEDGVLNQARLAINKGYKKNKNISKIDNLQVELDRAVKNEDYEKASKLKKQIDKLKNKD